MGDARKKEEKEGKEPSREVGPDTRAGLCPACRHVRIVSTERGSTFLLCRLSAEDARYPKYPPQPVVSCPGFKR